MKPYLVKFILQGNDEIKDGDFYLFEGKINRCKKSIIPELKQLYSKDWNSKWYQKVIPFLYSRNTQDIKVTFDQQQWQEMSRSEKDDYLIETNQYTQVGKISPKVSWIKDGDEFEEDEIKIIYTKRYECLCERPDMYRTPEQATCSHMVDDHRGGDFCMRKIDVVEHIELMCKCCETFK
jgi:hypothetical protein